MCYLYDSLFRLDSMSHRVGVQEGGALLSGYNYTVRGDGKRTGVEEFLLNADEVNGQARATQRNVAYSYDNAGRLTSETGRDGAGVAYKLSWTLDGAGNRTGEVRLRAANAQAADWAGGNVTRTVNGYAQNGNDWLTLTTAQRGTHHTPRDRDLTRL